MWNTTKEVLSYCSGAMVGYTQSDEITILLRNDQKIETEPFLGNRISKLCSLVASTASVSFSLACTELLKKPTHATFDCRVFLVPKEEVNNVFLWRQKDSWKNCVSAVAYYGLKEKLGKKKAMALIDGKSNEERQEVIYKSLGLNMNDYPTKYKRGVCLVRKTVQIPIEQILSPEKIAKFGKAGTIVERSIWTVDDEIPLFNQDKYYIERFLA
jgi:tRNA(His) 5'-end guanylyltransferase